MKSSKAATVLHISLESLPKLDLNSLDFSSLKLTDLRLITSYLKLSVLGDRRYRSSFLSALGVPDYIPVIKGKRKNKKKNKQIDINKVYKECSSLICIPPGEKLLSTKCDILANQHINNMSDEEVLHYWMRILKECWTVKETQRFFYLFVKARGELLLEFTQLISEYKSTALPTAVIKGILWEIDNEDDLPKSSYELLEVKRTCNEFELKQSYKRLSKIYHPDNNKDNPDAQSNFIAIRSAYEDILRDIDKKQKLKTKSKKVQTKVNKVA